jgi:hypothetical protein
VVKDDDFSAHIRVRFKANREWWSYVGTDCLITSDIWNRRPEEAKIDNPECASMNLDIENETNEEYIRRHVIHEFGHTLGFMHEQQRSDFPYKVNIEKAKKENSGYKDLNAAQIQRSILGALPGPDAIMYGTATDKSSIMIYPFAVGKFEGAKEEIKYNTTISDEDLKYAHEAYP